MSIWAEFSTSDIGDPEGTRTVIAIIALLVVMGLALIMVAFWLRRSTRPDPEFLAPLELMGERSWRNGDPVWQRRRLDEVRPDDAIPLRRSVAPPLVDESFDAGPSASGFEDLQGDASSADRLGAHADDEEGGATTPAETPAVGTDAAQQSIARDWPPKPPVVSLDPTGDSDDAGVSDGDGAPSRDPDDVSVAAGVPDRDSDGDPTPTTLFELPFDDLPDRDIDPAELERAMAELDAELERRRDDG